MDNSNANVKTNDKLKAAKQFRISERCIALQYKCDATADAISTAVWQIIIPTNFSIGADVIHDSLYLNNCQFYNY